MEPVPPRRGEAVVERVLDEGVGERVMTPTVVDDDFGRDGLAERRGHDVGVELHGRRKWSHVEPAAEHARGREHSASVVGQQFHPAADGRADVAGEGRVRHQGDATHGSLGFAWAEPRHSARMGVLPTERLEFSLLGPLAVAGEQGPVELGAPKHRALLALLLLEPGRVVSVDRLIDQLWHGEPPAAATSTLQAYVSNLRRVLEPNRTAGAPATVLVTRPPGYVLDIAPEQVDAARFERNVTAAIEARERGRLDDAGVYLTDALALWRGQPLADVAYESWAQSECERLKELHLVALETQLSVDLERGRHTSVAVEAERLAKEYPVRERFRELLMLALYRSGRQADALRAYQEARDVLVEELGIEPGPELRSLEEKILAQDPGLGWHAPSAGGNAPVAVDEAPSATFVGRIHERARLIGRLGEVQAGSGRLVLLSGEPGIGKTRLSEQLSSYARSQNMRVVWGARLGGRWRATFWPWVQVLRTLAEQSPVDELTAGDAGQRRRHRGGRSRLRALRNRRRRQRPMPSRRASASSRPSRRCCATSPRNKRSSSCSTTCTGPTRAHCGCWSSPSSALQQSPVLLVGTFRRRRSAHATTRQHARDVGAHRRPRTAGASGAHCGRGR